MLVHAAQLGLNVLQIAMLESATVLEHAKQDSVKLTTDLKEIYANQNVL